MTARLIRTAPPVCQLYNTRVSQDLRWYLRYPVAVPGGRTIYWQLAGGQISWSEICICRVLFPQSILQNRPCIIYACCVIISYHMPESLKLYLISMKVERNHTAVIVAMLTRLLLLLLFTRTKGSHYFFENNVYLYLYFQVFAQRIGKNIRHLAIYYQTKKYIETGHRLKRSVKKKERGWHSLKTKILKFL